MNKNVLSNLTLALHGATLRLETDYLPFFTYARRYLLDFPLAGEVNVDVSVHLHWDAVPPLPDVKQNVHWWGRRVLQEGSRVLQTELSHLPGLQLVAEWSGQMLLIDAYYRPTSRLERLIHRFKHQIPRLFVILIYYLIYFPLIHYLEQTQNRYLLHAGALDHPAGGQLLAGLPGSGKSTFTVGLLTDSQTYLLSENLLLFDACQVYAFPEPIHLSSESQALLPAAARKRLINAGRTFSHRREDFSLPSTARQWQTRPKNLFFLSRAGQTACHPLPVEVALSRLLAFDQQAKEVNAYNQFAAALEVIAPQPGRMQHYQVALSILVSSLNCYDLQLEQGAALAKAISLALPSEMMTV